MEMTKIIAELGINHLGDIEIAKRMICSAKDAGADYVKFQKRDVDWCYTSEELKNSCESPWGTTVEDKVRGRELNWDQFKEIDRFCRNLCIDWSASCFDLKSLNDLESLFPYRPWNKVPSAMAVHQEFIESVARYKRLALVSIGLCTDKQVESISDTFERHGCDYVFLHTTALYPCPLDRLNLSVIPVLVEAFHEKKHCVGVGYSGHEVGVMPSVMACGMGAMWIERHFTLDRSMYGADQAASLEPEGLKRLVRDIRSLSSIRGDGVRRLLGDEKNPVRYFRSA